MGIFKPKTGASPSPFQIRDLDAEASAHMEEARKKADAIIRAAKEEAARIVNAGEEGRASELARGFVAGREEGIEKGRAESRLAALAEAQGRLSPGAARVESLLGQLGPALEQAVRRASSDAEAGVMRLALAIARAVVKREVALDESVVRGNVAAAIALAAKRGGLEVRVHPADRVLLDQFAPELAERFDGLEIARVVEDETVDRGGAKVAWAEGSADAGISEQLSQIERLLLGDRS
ncbi:MAG: flagellar assembly protein [Planctomycetota bacterium]|nr:MAG: flagellar assembly protein [Planctomycetota bacterium]